MTLAAVLDECVTITTGAAGTGIIRDYEELAHDHNDFQTKFMSGGVINAIEITRRATIPTYITGFLSQHDHQIVFNFYRGVAIPADGGSDVSRAAHQALVEAVIEEFRNNTRLNGVAEKVDLMHIEVDGHVEKFGTLMHYSLGMLAVREDRET